MSASPEQKAALDQVIAEAREHLRPSDRSDATVVVPAGAGARIPDFDPDRELGVPDPEIMKTVAEGQTRYHLDTLQALDAESRQEPPPKPKAKSSALVIPAMSLMAIALAAGLSPSTDVEAATQEAERRRRQRERDEAARSTAKLPERPRTTGCRGAGCRTLGECLCSCRKCRKACRKR